MANEYRKIRPEKKRWYLLVLLIWITVLFVGIVCKKRFKLNFSDGIIAIAGAATLITIATFLKRVKVRYYSNFVDKFIRKRELLQSYIDENGKEIITYYPLVSYKVIQEENSLFIRFRIDGSSISDKLDGIGQPLADCFETVCLETIRERGYVTYVLELKEQYQETYEKYEDLPEMKFGFIKVGNVVIPWLKHPHMLITGVTQMGKTTTVQMLMYLLKKQYVRVVYLDPKNDIDIFRFCDKYDIEYYADKDEIIRFLNNAEEEIRIRQKSLEDMEIDEATFEPVYIFFDEMIGLAMSVSKNEYEKVQKIVTSIILQGAKKGYFFGAMLQRPDTKYLEGLIRENLNVRIVMGEASDIAYKMAFPDTENVKNYRREKGAGLIYRVGLDTRPKEILVPTIVSNLGIKKNNMRI